MATIDLSRLITAEAKVRQAAIAKHAAVNIERQRRIEAGTIINGVYVTGRDEDARNLTNRKRCFAHTLAV